MTRITPFQSFSALLYRISNELEDSGLLFARILNSIDYTETCDFKKAYHMRFVSDDYELPASCTAPPAYDETLLIYKSIIEDVDRSKQYDFLSSEVDEIDTECFAFEDRCRCCVGLRLKMRGAVCANIADYLRDKVPNIERLSFEDIVKLSLEGILDNEYLRNLEAIENDIFKFKAALFVSDVTYYLSGLFLIDALV